MTATRPGVAPRYPVDRRLQVLAVDVARTVAIAWSRVQTKAARVRLARSRDPQLVEVAAAWQELRSRSELLWVPPLWRANSGERRALKVQRRHAISALDENLRVEIKAGGNPRGLCIRVATGPLADRFTSSGVADPTAPSAQLHPDLDVTAASFEEAIIALRDAARRVYGPAGEQDRFDVQGKAG